MKRLEHMKEALMACVENQITHLERVDAKELGEAIDMIKDLEEAIYYCTITKAMNSPQYEKELEQQNRNYYPMMYYGGNGNGSESSSNSSSSGGGRQYYSGTYDPWKMQQNYEMEHEKEGRAGKIRRQYMESKSMKKDKTVQMRELEKYMQELSADIIEMIDEATPEEKQYLSKKMTGLAEKINKLN